MKMCDQVVSLISPEHAQTILWNEEGDDDLNDDIEMDHDESDRIITFEVAQTNEQEESVTLREGFKVNPYLFRTLAPASLTNLVKLRPQAVSRAIELQKDSTNDPDPTKPAPIAPFLLFGETTQGFMTVEHREASTFSEPFAPRTMEMMQLGAYLYVLPVAHDISF